MQQNNQVVMQRIPLGSPSTSAVNEGAQLVQMAQPIQLVQPPIYIQQQVQQADPMAQFAYPAKQ